MAGIINIPVSEAALTKEPQATPLILDILGKLPFIEFFDSLIEMLRSRESPISGETYTEIIKAMGKMQKTTAAKLNVIDFLFDILDGDITLTFGTDDHFYSIVAQALFNLIGANDQKHLQSSILAYVAEEVGNGELEDMIHIAEKI